MEPSRNRWLFPSIVGGGVFAAVIWLLASHLRIQPLNTAPVSTPPTAPKIVLVNPAAVDKERAELENLEPLFLPTDHNTSVLDLPPKARREPGSMSFSFSAKALVPETGGGVTLPEPIPVPASLVAAVEVGEKPNPFPELGMTDVTLPTVSKRLGFVQVRQARTGSLALSEDIPPTAEAVFAESDWAPVEYLVAVSAAGVVGDPIVIDRIVESEDVENYFRTFLVKRLRLGARLSPGFYTVAVGP